MSPARPCLQDLSIDLAVLIACRLAEPSPDPMLDLRNLRATCKIMDWVCQDRRICWSIPLQWAFTLVYTEPAYGENLIAQLDNVVDKLANADNTEACFLKGMRVVFKENCGALRAPLDMLERATKDEHNLTAYTLAMCLYKRNGGAADDKEAMRLLRKIEGDAVASSGGRTPFRFKNEVCYKLRLQASMIVMVRFAGNVAVPLPVACDDLHCCGPHRWVD
ncbi:unnamed protein product [Urochloa humidicola]